MIGELTGPERCMIYKPASFRTARPTHKVTCAGCDCEPGTTCDTQKRCACGRSKTSCDADIDTIGTTCCHGCQHIDD